MAGDIVKLGPGQKERPAGCDQRIRRRDGSFADGGGRAHPGLQGRLGEGGGFMAAVLPHGMRAIALDITPDNDAGGFILPNDHVDVILTRRDKWAEKIAGVEKYASETILRNVRVLAVDQSIEDKEGQKVAVGKTATVELDPQQAETLALARQIGTLSLTLRSLLDSQSPTPEGGGQPQEQPSRTINTVRFGVSAQSAAH
jgi:pilus assembly protein CpaB